MVSITLPANAEKLSKEQIIIFADQKGYERRAMPPIPKNVYRINEMLLQAYPFKGDFKNNDLVKQKESMDALHKGKKSYSSNTRMFGSYSAQIARSIDGDKETYYILIMNDAKTAQLNIILDCERTDETTAKTVIDEMLNSVKFKE